MESSHYCLRTPTTEIRLLELIPAAASGNLRCLTRRTALSESPPFVSVSHVWGTEKADRLVQVESGCGTKNLPMSQNLEALLVRLLCYDSQTLPQLWDGTYRLPMWIDMLCINQSDIGEKASQIALMREIYQKARCVIIWINENDTFLHYGFEYLRQAARNRLTTEERIPEIEFDPLGWDAITKLLNCDWFHRRWVIQEAVVPKNAIFLCGTDSMKIDDFFHGIDVVVKALLARPKVMKTTYLAHVGTVRPAQTLRSLRRSYDHHQQQPSLLWLLENLRMTRATLAHDQIYALLGLCSPEEVAKNPIRYDLEPEEAYRLSTVAHAQLYNDLDFLGLCTPIQRDILTTGHSESPKPRPFTGPSWVPNWHSKHLRRCLGLGYHRVDRQMFCASGTIPVVSTSAGNKLTVSGIFVDKIKILGDFCSPDRTPELSDANSKLFQQYFDFWLTPGIIPMPYQDDISRIETFARTLSLFGVYLEPVPSSIELLEMFHHWCHGSALGDLLERRGFLHNATDRANGGRGFLRMRRLLSWQPFITDLGYIGLSRENCSVDDEIWIIGGSSVPILLHSKMEGSCFYEVRGETVIDGFMFGEVTNAERQVHSLVQQVTLV